MKKLICLLALFLVCTGAVFANDTQLLEEKSIQKRVNSVGTDILNSNKIDKRVVFVYDADEKYSVLKSNKTYIKREVIVFGDTYKNIDTDDELAAYISREIAGAVRSYQGLGNGWLSSIKIKAAPKKYELVFDKLAVDYMVNAGYNPLGLIIFINKTYPQLRHDKLSSNNLTSKRLANIYERIYSKYPSYLKNNEYLCNKYYQNFLLTSAENRKIAVERVNNPRKSRNLKYE